MRLEIAKQLQPIMRKSISFFSDLVIYNELWHSLGYLRSGKIHDIMDFVLTK